MPATEARAEVGNVTVQVNTGGPHAPEDFNSDLYAEKVARLLNKFGYSGTFTVFPGNLHKGGGGVHHFGRMLVHGTNSRDGINCSANFEGESDRHFDFGLALPGLDPAKTVLELKGHLEREYGAKEFVDEQSEVEDQPADSPQEPELELIPLSDAEEAVGIREKATRDANEARHMLSEAEGQIAFADGVLDRAKSLVAELPGLRRAETELYAKLAELQAEAGRVEAELGRTQTKIANYEPLERFLEQYKNSQS